MKRILTLFILTLSIMVLVAGCGTTKGAMQEEKKSDQKPSSSNNAGGNKPPLKITIAGGSAGGFWSSIGEGIGETIKRAYPGTTFTYAPGQDGANVITVTTGQAEFAINQVPLAKLALEGKEPYKKKVDNLRAVAYLHSTPYHFVVSKDSGLNSIEQIVKTNYPLVASVNTKDSSSELTSRILFEAYGTSYEKIEKNGGKIQFIVASKANDQVKDNKMQALITPVPLPTASFVELNTSKPIKLLPLSAEAIKLLKERLGAKPDVIKAGTYDFVKEDIPTASIDTLLMTSSSIPEDVVYKVTKAIYEQLDFLYTVHISFKAVNKNTIAGVSGIPLHPGAEKFYKEIGAIK